MTRHKRIKWWDDERAQGNPIMVTLIEGFAFEPSTDESVACHVHGYDTVKDALSAVRMAKPCTCARCTDAR